MYCHVCGVVDEHYDENSELFHDDTPKHICNLILRRYKKNKSQFSNNKCGISVLCNVNVQRHVMNQLKLINLLKNCTTNKIRVYVKPHERVTFSFSINNNTKEHDFGIVGIQCAHPQPQFVSRYNPHLFGSSVPYILKSKSSLIKEVTYTFEAEDIGHYEMPIIFTFQRNTDGLNVIIVLQMVVMVQENEVAQYQPTKYPYTNEHFDKAGNFIKAPYVASHPNEFKIPLLLKKLFPLGLEEDALDRCKESPEMKAQLRNALVETRAVFDEGINVNNYVKYFHYLLWWEEVVARINLKRYNMSKVNLVKVDTKYQLEVPGLSENRPSLLRGDRVLIGPHKNNNIIFEMVIKSIADDHIVLDSFDHSFHNFYKPQAFFDVRFVLCLVPLERSHHAVSNLHSSMQTSRVFPEPNKTGTPVQTITRFYNNRIANNPEQASAVRHIFSGTSGKAPYLVYGPPGTGKTMTIVEAIIQIVVSNPTNRVLVCTDSNMAADHIASMLLKHNDNLDIDNFIFRACSRNRVWTVLPSCLMPVCNGTNYDNCYSVDNYFLSKFRIVVTTLLHAAKYSSKRSQNAHKLVMSHLFIDEAAQASEPAALVPITGLLAPRGNLVLAGDPEQLGPVCNSKSAGRMGLGTSLMERLKVTYNDMYDSDPKYITMLIKNYRSNPDILKLSNELFYDNKLEALAEFDPISNVSILGDNFGPGGERAVVFHAVNSKEQRIGKSPSYFNEKELDMLKRYVHALVVEHHVAQNEIGIIAPYIRQVYKMKYWLTDNKYGDIEIGTVEAFQGKEKRVMLVSTVRANCKLLDYDAKYALGFLVDDKRFNVALTRAKAKLVIIGNRACLDRDIKWRKYMELCEEFGCSFGNSTQQLPRTASLLDQLTNENFKKFRITEAMASTEEEEKQISNEHQDNVGLLL